MNHELQWKDPTGDFRRFLVGLVEESKAELIAEEAYSLPTTVGQRLACRMDRPWMDVDMDHTARVEAGICEELKKRPCGPLFDGQGNPAGEAFGYLPHADQIREEHWVRRILERRVGSVIVVCGPLHVAPLAEKLRSKGQGVKEIKAWEFGWYISLYGMLEISEQDGNRWCNIHRKDSRKA